MRADKFMARLTIISGIVLFLFATGLAQDVRYNFLPSIDFSKYKTYRWSRVEKAEYPDQLLDEQITRAIDAQLTAKGLTKTESENSDLIATYQLAITQEKQWNAYSTGGDYW